MFFKDFQGILRGVGTMFSPSLTLKILGAGGEGGKFEPSLRERKREKVKLFRRYEDFFHQ